MNFRSCLRAYIAHKNGTFDYLHQRLCIFYFKIQKERLLCKLEFGWVGLLKLIWANMPWQTCKYLGFTLKYILIFGIGWTSYPPLYCRFRGVSYLQLIMKTTENGSNGNFCPHLLKKIDYKLLIWAILSGFGEKLKKANPLKWKNTGNGNSNLYKICF